MLHSLLSSTTNLNQLVLEGALAEREPYRPRERYEELKAGKLYHLESGLWSSHLRKDGEPSNERGAKAQIIAALIDVRLDRASGVAHYQALKQSPLFDERAGFWNWSVDDSGAADWLDCHAYVQLLGVLMEVQIDRGQALAHYSTLKRGSLFDGKLEQWNSHLVDTRNGGGSTRWAFTQLTGILVEAEFDIESAHRLYEKLKKTPLFDPGAGQWNESMSAEQIANGQIHFAATQLLGILVEAKLYPQSAPAAYERLRARPLFDEAAQTWNRSIFSSGDCLDDEYNAETQLLGVLVELELLRITGTRLAAHVPPMPTTEEW